MRRDPLVRALRLLQLPPGATLAAVAAGVAAAGSALGLAALAAWLIARAWQMPPVLDLSVAVVSVRALGISRGLFRYLERLATHNVAFRGTTQVRTTIYRRLASGDPATVAGLKRGELLTRTGADVDTVGAVVVRALVPMAVALLIGAVSVVLMATISFTAAGVLAASLLVAGVLGPALSARAAKASERAEMEFGAAYQGAVSIALRHAAELRVAGRLDAATRAAHTADGQAMKAADRAARDGALAAAVLPLSVGAAVLGSLLVGLSSYPGDSPSMTPMSLAIMVLLPLAAFEVTVPMSEAAVALSRARVASGRLMALLDRTRTAHTDTDGSAVPAGEALCARGLRAGWPGGRIGGPVDLDLDPGARVAVVGPSGAGKTTLLMTLAGLLAPVTGVVSLGASPLQRLDARELRRVVTFFAEDAHLFDTTILENLRVARGDVTEEQAIGLLDAVGLGAWVRGLPDGLHTVLTGGDRAVSGGQRRRLLLARALASPARVLLLDEPTEHLDDAAGAALLRALLDRASGLVEPGRTVVLVTHQLPGDHRADQVLNVDFSEREITLPAR